MNNKIINLLKNNGNVWKLPLAAALSWEAAKWAGSHHPYLAPLTAILSIQITLSKSIQFAWQRVLGTIAGVLLTSYVAPIIGLSGWSIGLLLLLASIIVKSMKLKHEVLIQIALSILLVLYFQVKMPSYPSDRIRDTIVGAVIALLIHILLLPPDSIKPANQKMIQSADHLTVHFFSTAQWVKDGCSSSKAQTMEDELQALFQELHQATTELDKANQSLHFNPLAQKKRNALNELTRQMDQLRASFANLSDMIRIFMKWSENGYFTREDGMIWADHLNTLGALVKSWKETLEDPDKSIFEPNAAIKQIKAPAYMENYQYQLALYMNAEQVIQDFEKNIFLNKNV
ncbi:aromatic acid exporter family protein [Paenibacillus sp.]|uniref:FUSC family protein n=1 Tax=Paenibacillus sp. TaxID=58172 RepID=UPI00282EF942|nr:aromatic acid exporter family protein [Paenibacillus sp.]MDR0269940.1 aromatic acid exporter family protein [Paenibacillus sp.]